MQIKSKENPVLSDGTVIQGFNVVCRFLFEYSLQIFFPIFFSISKILVRIFFQTFFADFFSQYSLTDFYSNILSRIFRKGYWKKNCTKSSKRNPQKNIEALCSVRKNPCNGSFIGPTWSYLSAIVRIFKRKFVQNVQNVICERILEKNLRRIFNKKSAKNYSKY